MMSSTLTRARIFAAALLLGSVAGCAFHSHASSTLGEGPCSLEQLVLRTDDGVSLDGILYQPASKARATAILLVHGFGSNFYGDYFPRFARAAAERGYASLALNMRDHDTGPKVSDFIDNERDIAAGAAYLRKLGHPKLVLLGQSMGTNRVLYYQAASGDPSVVATVLVGPPGNLFDWNVWQFGRKEAQSSVEKALAMHAAGQDRAVMVVDLGPLGKALYSPRYLLSLRGPDARSDPYQNIRKVSNPVLIVQGRTDKLVESGLAARLAQAATSSRKVDLVYLDGADHSFRQQEGVLAERVLGWLEKVAP